MLTAICVAGLLGGIRQAAQAGAKAAASGAGARGAQAVAQIGGGVL